MSKVGFVAATFNNLTINEAVSSIIDSRCPKYLFRSIFRFSALVDEVLDEIVTYLPRRSLLQLSITCRLLQSVSSRQLYRCVEVTGTNATRCFLTLGSSNTTQPYGNYIRSLTYIATSYEDPSLQYQLLCLALAHTRQLISLHLDIPLIYSSLLVEKMYRSTISRSVYDYIDNGSVPLVSDPLPNLAQLSISGDINFIQLASFRTITALQIGTIDTVGDVQTLLECLTDYRTTHFNTSLIDLSLFLSFDNTIETIQTFHEMGKTMRAVEYLRIYNHNINALVSYFFHHMYSTDI
jgi:hypothetical protein